MRGWGIALCVLGLLAASPAVAGTLYRCDGADGGRSYVSKRVPGAKCVAISSYNSVQKTPASSAPASSGSATATVKVDGSPARETLPATHPAVSSAPPPSKAKFVRMATSTIYSYVDANGVRNFSNRRPRGVANVTSQSIQYAVFQMETCYACGLQPGINFGTTRLNTTAYKDEIAQASRDYGVDEAVIRAIIHAESAFRPTALSRVGAQGLMQLMPATARRFGVSDSYNAAQNIQGGVQYLAWLLKRYGGDLKLAAAGYNAGEGAVDKYKGVPPYSETRRYVDRVSTLAERYRGSLAQR
ncbi:lytic transglycosylase domain-containing protein [Pseudoluteimonas lycopersici]|uniref:Lytic transglycosylase domain-containing protein n=1 Tax=Pseudoluteimonas lycopersici TaxID=1324796 RepID=A0A516V4G4_9GAMM|nr:lytic transglycosylase domain-containing protein [Lysobacter lycopersici]QDQ73422.1 lytic transglycosylase domain-containing protein [Lysobacter lycopersici]